jgi:hypothetical protein
MSNFLREGRNWLADTREQELSDEVTYSRPALGSVVVQSMRGETVQDLEDESGFLIRAESRDFIIKRNQLRINDTLIEPEEGDEIIEERDGVTLTYEVASIGSEPHHRFADPFRLQYRIHTKLISDGS